MFIMMTLNICPNRMLVRILNLWFFLNIMTINDGIQIKGHAEQIHKYSAKYTHIYVFFLRSNICQNYLAFSVCSYRKYTSFTISIENISCIFNIMNILGLFHCAFVHWIFVLSFSYFLFFQFLLSTFVSLFASGLHFNNVHQTKYIMCINVEMYTNERAHALALSICSPPAAFRFICTQLAHRILPTQFVLIHVYILSERSKSKTEKRKKYWAKKGTPVLKLSWFDSIIRRYIFEWLVRFLFQSIHLHWTEIPQNVWKLKVFFVLHSIFEPKKNACMQMNGKKK